MGPEEEGSRPQCVHEEGEVLHTGTHVRQKGRTRYLCVRGRPKRAKWRGVGEAHRCVLHSVKSPRQHGQRPCNTPATPQQHLSNSVPLIIQRGVLLRTASMGPGLHGGQCFRG